MLLIPNNPDGEIDPNLIDWESAPIEKLNINWQKIQFLVIVEQDGKPVLKMHPKVPQMQGFGSGLAIEANLIRLIRTRLKGGDKLIEKLAKDRGLLFNIATGLINGDEIPLS